jgi:hypothetical protein
MAPAASPASSAPFGGWYPSPGDPCLRPGENSPTASELDDSAILVACPTAEAAPALAGRASDAIEGVQLV